MQLDHLDGLPVGELAADFGYALFVVTMFFVDLAKTRLVVVVYVSVLNLAMVQLAYGLVPEEDRKDLRRTYETVLNIISDDLPPCSIFDQSFKGQLTLKNESFLFNSWCIQCFVAHFLFFDDLLLCDSLPHLFIELLLRLCLFVLPCVQIIFRGNELNA